MVPKYIMYILATNPLHTFSLAYNGSYGFIIFFFLRIIVNLSQNAIITISSIGKRVPESMRTEKLIILIFLSVNFD